MSFTANSIVAWYSFSSCWRLLLRSISICFYFTQLFCWIFQMILLVFLVVHLSKRLWWNQLIPIIVSLVLLLHVLSLMEFCFIFCFFLFLVKTGLNFRELHMVLWCVLELPHFELLVHVLFLSEELHHRRLTLDWDILLWRYQVGCCTLGILSLESFILVYGQLLFYLCFADFVCYN